MASDYVKLNLHGLPPETLQMIAGYLNDSHRPSLFAFGLASKTCHNATIPSIFHHIRLEISSREALQRDIDVLVKSLARTESACHVRCLSIKGHLQLPVKPKIEGYKSGTLDRYSWFKKTGVNEILSDEEPCTDAPHVVYDEPVIVKSSEEDLAWLPASGLIKTLPHLAKLVYDCQNQFPPSLLDALHVYHPQCQLYHLTFRFRTLLWGTPYPYEMALATSPCLYSVKVICSKRDSEGDDDFNQEAIMELAAGLAPNLYDRRPRDSWRGLPGFVTGHSIGSLTSLSLLGIVNFNLLGMLRDWAKHTDFSHLQHLTLGGGYDCDVGMIDEAITWIITNCSFPKLKTLNVRLDRHDYMANNPNFAMNAIALFNAFEPLEQLSVSGPLEPKILDAILDRHGQTLTKLNLRPSEDEHSLLSLDARRIRREIPMTFTKELILHINAQCPVLEELTVSIKRTKSDALEAEIYKSFGRMERLRSLFLILDCSNWSVARDPDLEEDALFDLVDREPWRTDKSVRKGHVREALMNCAVDDTLARSIWETICQNKAGQKLMTLKLWTYGGGHFGGGKWGYIPDVVNNLSRSWLIERVARDDGDIINVRELGQRARDARDQQVTDRYKRSAYLRRGVDDDVIEPEVVAEGSDEVQVFRRVWPRKEGSKDWRKDWSSLPL
ncbi:hypothetical protein VTL71DRAFT_6488 [Oculimacula yallundae]|uniref:F-box domain-containing protein n=1 Tax=Oculimacula yallundae TaxID=86028 RepID=A0ABR4BY08_9HELO